MTKRETRRIRLGAWLSIGLIAVAMTPPAYAQDETSDDAPSASPLPKKGGKAIGPRNLPMPPGARGLPGLPPDGGPLGQGPTRDLEPDDDADDEDSSSSSAKGRQSGSSAESAGADRQKPPSLAASNTVNIDFVGIALSDLVRYMAEVMEMNFIIDEDLKGDVTIVSHKPISKALAYEAFLSALEVAGYTTVTVGKATKIVKTGDAANAPTRVYQGANIPFTENYVTQIIELENVSVADISSVVKELASRSASVIAYSPTNTLILTDNANNIRRVYKVIKDLDVSAPLSRLAVIPLVYADAADIEKIIEELYGTEAASTSSDSSSASRRSASRRRRSSSSKKSDDSSSSTATKVGDAQYISKVISDERTNSLIVLANEEAMKKIHTVVAELDRDVDPSSRSQIHVVYLEHAKAEDVATVLSNLSEQSSSSSSRRSSSTGRSTANSRTRGGRSTASPSRSSQDTSSEESTGVTAAFDSGVRVTSDENTNSLVIIASPEDFRVIKEVIDKLDVRRKQVFVECVIMEIASDETFDVGMGYHGGAPGDDGSLSLVSSQLNGYSLGLDSTDLLSGLAMGVFGEMVDVTVSDGAGGTTDLSVPSFGIALNALQSNSLVNILSTPNVLTLDNEEASISVGRNIPVPTSTSFDSNNNPIVSYQREDVGIQLTVTPQINESNFVTLEVSQEVSEIEEDSSGLDTSAGFITSQRKAETTVLVHDNQTIVLGGLIANTETFVETKIPILGDIPLIGALFRGKRETARKTNLLIVLTPHVISEPSDLEEVYRIKVAQRNEFLRRFYGKTPEQQQAEMRNLLQYSMNLVDQPSVYRTKIAADLDAIETPDIDVEVGGALPVVPLRIDGLDDLDSLDELEE